MMTITTIGENICVVLSLRRKKSLSSMETCPKWISLIQTLSYGIEPTIWYFLRSIEPYLYTLLKALFAFILHSISRKIFTNDSLKVTTSISLTYCMTYIQSSNTISPFHNILSNWKSFGINLKISVPPLFVLALSHALATLWKQITYANTWNMFHVSSRVWTTITITYVLKYFFLILSISSVDSTLLLSNNKSPYR